MRVTVDHRYSMAMVSGKYVAGDLDILEIDRSLANLQSGSPILTLSGFAIALATDQVRDWIEVDERTSRRAIRSTVGRVVPSAYDGSSREGEDEMIPERRLFKLPLDYTLAPLLLSCADRLGRAGVPIHRVSNEAASANG
jgi:hypothetical protein